jgi:hypothetical protein
LPIVAEKRLKERIGVGRLLGFHPCLRQMSRRIEYDG